MMILSFFPCLCSRKRFLVVGLMLVLCKWDSQAFPNHRTGHWRPTFTSPATTTNLVFGKHTVKDFKGLYQNPFDSDPSDELASERRKGILVLATVPIAWGTFEPAVRYVYEIQPDIPPFVFSFVYYLTAATALSLAALTPLAPRDGEDVGEVIQIEDNRTNETGDKSNQLAADTWPIQGGIELGTYLFLGNALQVVGLKTVPADRAAFLLQLTTIFVPLVQSVLAKNLLAVPTKTWIACLIALSGVAFIGLDGSNDASLSLENLEFSIGDLYIVFGALFYTFHCIRLEGYAKTTSAVKLAAAKATTETTWCVLVVLLCILATTSDSMDFPLLDLARRSGDNILAYKESLSESIQGQDINSGQWFKLAAATVWTGLVPVAYTIYAQSFGQSRVPPATANLIYTIQPFFTALVAFLVLGETLGPAGYVGGSLIGAAVLLVIQDEDSSNGSSSESEGLL